MHAFVPVAQPGDKLKAIFQLGMAANFFTLVGAVLGLIVLGKTEWVVGFWAQAWYALCLTPLFMGDAINAYVLGRLRLEGERGWDDVQITPEGRQNLVGWFRLWRTLSFLTAVTLAGKLLTTLAPDPAIGQGLFLLFPILFLAHAVRCLHTLQAYVAPVLPAFGGRALVWRAASLLVLFCGWLTWLGRRTGPVTGLDLIGHGIVYFLICAWLQPLPSKYSILRPTRSAPDLGVTLLPEGLENAAERLAIQEAGAWWKGEGGFVSLGCLRLPLLELPLFQATGEALLSPDRSSLLLLLISEVKPRVHRALYSSGGDRAYVTTDFGAPEARFPDEILYETRPGDEPAADFLARHQQRCARCGPLEDPPWAWLEALVLLVLQFLARRRPGEPASGASPAAHGSAAVGEIPPARDPS